MSAVRITRRRVLALGLGVGVAAAATVATRRGSAPLFGQPRPELRAALASVLSDPAATRRLGSTYLQLEPRERSIDVLLRHLPVTGSTSDEVEAAVNADPAAVLARVAAVTTNEFAQHDTVVVDGWELGRSEARLAGLYAAVSA